MKEIIILISTIFLLTSCYSNPKDLEKIKELENEIYKLNIEIENNNFEKKKYIFEKNKECSDIDIDAEVKNNWGEKIKYDIEEIIYDFEKNTCISNITIINENGIQNWNFDIFKKKWY